MKNKLLEEILKYKDDKRACHCLKFFKTGKGDYGEGDIFLGLTAPVVRRIVKEYYKKITLNDIDELIKNKYHEIRMASLLICVAKFQKADNKEKEAIYNLYIKNLKYINNWDLVDLTAPHIVGAYLYNNKNTKPIYDMSKSKLLWAQRVSMLACLYFIRKQDFDLTLNLCRYFLSHKHDLIHKAAGWMLREIGKRDEHTLCAFLDEHAPFMPRTMLRYSIERLEKEKRQKYLSVKKIAG